MGTNKILCGDAKKLLKDFPDECVDLTVTSPPYDDLRAYNGYSFDFLAIAYELYRVTKQGGVVVWVVGDATVKGSETGTSFRQALSFMERGFNLHDTMIYQVAGTGAKGSNLAYWQSFEYMFVLSKGRPRTVNLIADKLNVRAGGVSTRGRLGRHGTIKDTARRVIKEMGVRENIWRYHVGNNGDDNTSHPAVFPEALAADHIISWSNEGDLVLDPFNGSGTTTKMAYKLGRKYLGIDISQEYCDIAEKRLQQGILL